MAVTAITDRAMADAADAAEPVEVEETWPIVVRLSVPIDLGKTQIDELTFRRGRMGDIKNIRLAADNISTDAIILIASRMCAQPVGVIERLDQDDAGRVSEIAMNFIAKCLKTGQRGSPT